MRIRFVAVLALTAATSLQAQTATPLAQTPTTAPAPVAPAPASTPAVDYATATPVPGNWIWTQVTGGSEATFMNASAMPQLTIHCTVASRRVTISRPATGAAPFLSVWTSSATRNLPSSYLPATGRPTADVSAYDPFLDAMVFSRGRLAIGVSGQATLVVPAWAEAARVVEDCRA
jgi:hypothetical protein